MAIDFEAGVRDYLRGRPAVQAIAEQRGFFSVPDRVTYPLYLISGVGGLPIDGEAPVKTGFLQIDCRGETKADAFALAGAITDELEAIRWATSLNADVIAYGADVEPPIWGPDPSDIPRYVVTAAVTARAA